jgi:hypothetical protein
LQLLPRASCCLSIEHWLPPNFLEEAPSRQQGPFDACTQMRNGAQPLHCPQLKGIAARFAAMGQTTRRKELIQLGWRAGIGAVLVLGGYLALLLIPLVLASGLEPKVKAALTGVIGFTPLLTKLAAVALLGKPALSLIKGVVARFKGAGEAD